LPNVLLFFGGFGGLLGNGVDDSVMVGGMLRAAFQPKDFRGIY
jgi:hypothetical protein